MRSVTFATNNGDIAGGEVMLFAMAEAARELGCDVTVVAPTAPADVLDEAVTRRFRAVEIKAGNRRDYIIGLRAWDARERQGLLWCNGLVPSFATAGHPNRVIHLHQRPQNRAQEAAYVAAKLRARRIVVPSFSMARDLPGSTSLPNWVPEVVLPDGPHERSPRGTMLGFLGRLSVDKGVVVLAEALEILDREHPGLFRLLLGGEARHVADDRADLVRAALARVDHLVHHAGWMDREDFFSSVDLAVFPSVWPESFGLVVAEAQSAKVPFVITDAGALPEVAGGNYPWIAEAGNPESLARTIAYAAKEVTPAHLERSFERWQEEFSPSAGRRRLADHLVALGVLPAGSGS